MNEEEKPIKAKKKSSFNFSLLIAIILFMVSLGMAGLFSWAVADFRKDVLADDAFWFSLLISTIINFFALMSVITYLLPQKLKTDEHIKEREDTLFKFNLTTDSQKLELFCIDLNFRRKKKAYINKVNSEKKKFIKKYKPSMIDKKLWYNGSLEEKQKNEYCLKLLEYEELISDAYIKENLMYIDINFPAVTPAMIISESAQMKDGELVVHDSAQKTAWWIWHIVPRYIASSSLTVTWAVFFVTMVDGIDLKFWLDFMVRLVGMLLNMSTGIYLVNSYIRSITIGDLDVRLSLARQYIIWEKAQNPVI